MISFWDLCDIFLFYYFYFVNLNNNNNNNTLNLLIMIIIMKKISAWVFVKCEPKSSQLKEPKT